MSFQISGFGVAPISRTRRSVEFRCPNDHCRSHRTGNGRAMLQVRTARNWATALYIPVIPLADLGIHGRCSACKTNFTPDLFHLIAPEHFTSVRQF